METVIFITMKTLQYLELCIDLSVLHRDLFINLILKPQNRCLFLVFFINIGITEQLLSVMHTVLIIVIQIQTLIQIVVNR